MVPGGCCWLVIWWYLVPLTVQYCTIQFSKKNRKQWFKSKPSFKQQGEHQSLPVENPVCRFYQKNDLGEFSYVHHGTFCILPPQQDWKSEHYNSKNLWSLSCVQGLWENVSELVIFKPCTKTTWNTKQLYSEHIYLCMKSDWLLSKSITKTCLQAKPPP